MLFQRLKTPGLAHHSYVLECGPGEVIVVDPRRDIFEYLALARAAEANIAYVLETHRQEDFEYGSAALAELTGARIVTGAHALFGRSDVRLREGEALEIGATRIVVLETPGHTPESVCYAVYREDAGGKCWGVFTGDTLFVSETGRTDLSDPSRTAQNAGLLYDAVHAKLAPLGEQALIFPAHGSGSACGGNIAERDDSTLGIERATNPVFTRTRADFIAHKVSEKLPRPPYFSHMERVNLEAGRPLKWPPLAKMLPPQEFDQRMREGVVIDTRPPDAFAAAHVPGAYNVWLGGLATFAGWIADETAKIFLVVPSPQTVEDAILSLARIGIDNIEGVLAGGIANWREQGLPISETPTLSAEQAAKWREEDKVPILDVRDQHEWEEGHIPGALHTYVGELERQPPRLPKDRPLVVHCSVGNRSGVAVSMLERQGFTRVYNMLGGMKAWRSLALPVERP